MLWIWIPFDLRLLNHTWLWPPGDAEYAINTLFALTIVAPLYIYLRGIPKVGLPLRWQRTDFKTISLYTNAYTLIGVPLGFLTAFLAWNPQTNLGSWFSQPLGIFFFIAVPEELLFRGIFLSFLEDKIKAKHVPLILSSVLFGLSHLNNPPLWDWRYLIMSSLAGVVYGLAFMRSRNLLAPIIIHTIVDYVWVQLLLSDELLHYSGQ
ncbi:MAG: lysostaphin resistance A-like protein [Oligoflexales bacterium]